MISSSLLTLLPRRPNHIQSDETLSASFSEVRPTQPQVLLNASHSLRVCRLRRGWSISSPTEGPSRPHKTSKWSKWPKGGSELSRKAPEMTPEKPEKKPRNPQRRPLERLLASMVDPEDSKKACWSPRFLQETPRQPQGGSKMVQDGSKRGPRESTRQPKRPQRGQKAAQESPKSSPREHHKATKSISKSVIKTSQKPAKILYFTVFLGLQACREQPKSGLRDAKMAA